MDHALLIVSFGGPEGPDDVAPFLANVTRGRDVPPARLAEVAATYQRFGGVSPINAHCRALVEAVRSELAARGRAVPVYWGNRNWHPFLADTLAAMRDDGITRAAAFITSPYSSYSSCRQYLDDIAAATARLGPGAPAVERLPPCFDAPGFLEPVTDATRCAIDSLTATGLARERIAVLFSAHSIPLSMDAAADYRDQIAHAARAVATALALPDSPVVWQSRSGPPQVPWLEPDVGAAITALDPAHVDGVVVVPIGFVADHMEVVYDLDVVAADAARARGLAFARATTPGTDPRFVALIADQFDAAARGPRTRESPFRPGLVYCSAECCPAPARRG